MDMNFASKGVAGAGLGLGIAGTALGVLNGGGGGILGAWLFWGYCFSGDHTWNGSDRVFDYGL